LSNYTFLPRLDKRSVCDESARCAALFKIKTIRKAAAKNELLGWLRLNPIVDKEDVEFLQNEAGKTDCLMLVKESEADEAAKAALLTSKELVTSSPYPTVLCSQHEQ
jgi:hypothetical protein